MRTFLLKNNKPTILWGQTPKYKRFKGLPPKGYDLAVSMDDNYVILDVDVKNDKNGFDHIPKEVLEQLKNTFNYKTKNNGAHFWIEYKGNKYLMNRATKFGLDLRTSKGYVKYPIEDDPYSHLSEVYSHPVIDNFLESLYTDDIKLSDIKK